MASGKNQNVAPQRHHISDTHENTEKTLKFMKNSDFLKTPPGITSEIDSFDSFDRFGIERKLSFSESVPMASGKKCRFGENREFP